MENLSFRIDKKITPVRIGKNKYRFEIDKTGADDIKITQDKIEDVIYSVFDSSEFLDLVRIITNIKGKQKNSKNLFAGCTRTWQRACKFNRLWLCGHY